MSRLKSFLFVLLCLFGLHSQAQWKKSEGKFSNSNVSNFIVVNSLILGGTTNNGIIISDDCGKTWDKNIQLKYPINYLFNFEGILIGYFGYEHTYIVYSKDKGNTWIEVPTDTLFNHFSKFIYSLTFHNNAIYITNGKGIFKTNDWGENWEYVSQKFGYRSNIISYDNYLFAINKKIGLWYSIDNGKTWVKELNIEPHYINLKKINNKLVASNKGYLYELKTPGGYWEKAFNMKLDSLIRINAFCCNAYIVSGLNIIFSDNNIISLPKVPITEKYNIMLPNAVINYKDVITASFTNHHIWFLEYKLNLTY